MPVAYVVEHICTSRVACRDFELEGYELTRRELISPVLILAALLNPKLVELRAEAQVHGTLGHGPIDYTAHIEKIQMLLAEAKRFDLGSRRGQVRRNQSLLKRLLLMLLPVADCLGIGHAPFNLVMSAFC